MEVGDRDVSSLDLPKKFLDFLRHEWSIERLHPPQAKAIPSILSGRNTLVAIPTASGKSLLAYMAMIDQRKRGR